MAIVSIPNLPLLMQVVFALYVNNKLDHLERNGLVKLDDDFEPTWIEIRNKKLHQAFRRQANELTLNTPVFQGG